MIKKALIEFEGKTYWLEMNNDFPSVKTLENGKLRPTLVKEVDLFDLMERGHVIGDKKPE